MKGRAEPLEPFRYTLLPKRARDFLGSTRGTYLRSTAGHRPSRCSSRETVLAKFRAKMQDLWRVVPTIFRALGIPIRDQ